MSELIGTPTIKISVYRYGNECLCLNDSCRFLDIPRGVREIHSVKCLLYDEHIRASAGCAVRLNACILDFGDGKP